MPHRSDLTTLCSLCNTEETEDVIHFLAICPILKKLKRDHYEVDLATIDDVINVLDESSLTSMSTLRNTMRIARGPTSVTSIAENTALMNVTLVTMSPENPKN